MILVADIAALMAEPAVLILDGDMPAPALPLPLWRMRREGQAWVLARNEVGAPSPLHAAPLGVLGVLAADDPAWLSLWPGTEPPLVLRDVASCAALLAAQLQAALARNGALRGEVLALRAEHEAARLAIAHWQRSAAQTAPAAPSLLHTDTLGPMHELPVGRTRLARVLPVPLDQTCTLGINIRAALCGIGTSMRVRLIGAESARVAASWHVPGSALLPGWLMLDLPMPAPIWGETALVEVTIDVAPGASLVFADPAPSLRLFRSHGAPRFQVAPLHDSTEVGMGLPPDGIACALPDAIWRGRPRQLLLQPGGSGELTLPAVPVAGFDAVHASLVVSGGPVQAMLACGDICTGWRDVQHGELELVLALPAQATGHASVSVAMRAMGASPAQVEWRNLRASRGAR